MKFKDIQKLSDVKFRRLSGVSWATFNLMLAELNKHLPRHIGKDDRINYRWKIVCSYV